MITVLLVMLLCFCCAFTFDVLLSYRIVGVLCLDEDVGALIDLGQHRHLSFSSALEP